MWADVTSQDAVTAKPAQAETSTLGYYGATSQPSPLGPQVIAWGKRAVDAVADKYRGHVSSYEGFLQRRSETMTTRLQEVSGPSASVRQKANLSAPMGPLGSQNSKLRDARQGQTPTGEYPYPGGGIQLQQTPMSQDYIYPGYRGLGG
jgi:hypothetical protein